MEPGVTFTWPPSPPWPPQDWWELEGARLKLKPEWVRFAADRVQTAAGEDSKDNLGSTVRAGMNVSKTQAYRIARSRGVATLIKKAKEIKVGKRARPTEAELDEQTDRFCMSPDASEFKIGMEVRRHREAALREEAKVNGSGDSKDSTRQLLHQIGLLAAPIACAAHAADGGLVTCTPFFELLAPFMKNRFPEAWEHYRQPLVARVETFASEEEQRRLAEFDAAGNGLELSDAEFRLAIGSSAPKRMNGSTNGSVPDEVDTPAPIDAGEASANV